MTADDLYAEDHVPDPVTEGAVAAAMAATTPGKKSLGERAITFVLVFIGLLLTSLIVLGVFNAINNSTTSHKQAEQQTELGRQNACLTSLLQNFLVDQQSRTIIAADDRNAVRDLIKEITQAKTVPQKFQAIDNFNARSKVNDKRRASLPLFTPQCEGIKTGKVQLPATVVLPKIRPTATKTKASSAPTAGGTTASSAPAHAAPAPAPTPTPAARQHVATSRPAPQPTSRHFTRPLPSPTATTPSPIVSLPHVCLGRICIL